MPSRRPPLCPSPRGETGTLPCTPHRLATQGPGCPRAARRPPIHAQPIGCRMRETARRVRADKCKRGEGRSPACTPEHLIGLMQRSGTRGAPKAPMKSGTRCTVTFSQKKKLNKTDTTFPHSSSAYHVTYFHIFSAITSATCTLLRRLRHLFMSLSTISASASHRWPRQLSHTLLFRGFAAATPSNKPCPL